MSQTLPEFDFDGFLPYRMTVVAARLSAELAQHYKSTYGITTAQWRVILNVGYSGAVSVRDIEKKFNLEKSKISRAAAKLEAEGYITKEIDRADRRLVKLQLTPKGAQLLSELVPLAKAYQRKLEAELKGNLQGLQSALDILTQKEPPQG
ncbi:MULTISPECIES: MarR family winged helix-turn-helix transcriptional regulator [unclassified Ruegeria]|uniref:MarR family winged helix-turn-helix transcriptional regulator n=1 Tax=unclassified Ruegeria TaxID=2625375 RepID=UPI0014895EDC|nr:MULTISPECIES: MarR family transcriptional regulator [unclassified Ruegeria]